MLPSDFNPRSPHGERPKLSTYPRAAKTFQSTLPARGATSYEKGLRDGIHISIHAPRTGSDLVVSATSRHCVISIHAPRTGSDDAVCAADTVRHYFNPRSPHGERPHAALSRMRRTDDFNPRSPHGERHPTRRVSATASIFQSTLPARGATCGRKAQTFCTPISIHAPRTGSDGSRTAVQECGIKISIHAPRTGSDLPVRQ